MKNTLGGQFYFFQALGYKVLLSRPENHVGFGPTSPVVSGRARLDHALLRDIGDEYQSDNGPLNQWAR